MAKERVVEKVRSKLQASIEQAQEERRKELFRRRIQIARDGLTQFERHKLGDAVQNFKTYLRILEEWKRIAPGTLSPSHFDIKKDTVELLLISGVYWDLVKMYDRTKSLDKTKELLHYLDKYVIFSKGMPFEGLCAETLRKYIATDKPVHKEAFKNAYKRLANSNCFVATSLLDLTHVETLPRLRRLRDNAILKSAPGRLFVAWYYRMGPGIAKALDLSPQFIRKIVSHAIDGIAATSEAGFRFFQGGK